MYYFSLLEFRFHGSQGLYGFFSRSSIGDKSAKFQLKYTRIRQYERKKTQIELKEKKLLERFKICKNFLTDISDAFNAEITRFIDACKR